MGDWSISMTLSILLDAVERLVLAGLDLRAVELALERGEEGLVDERGLARAGDAGDADEAAERDADVDVLEVVLAAALELEAVLVRVDRAALRRG